MTLIGEASAAGIAFPAASVSGIEIFNVRNASGQTLTVNANNMTGETQFWSDRSTNNNVFTNVASGTEIGVRGNGSTANANTTATFGASVTSASSTIADGVTAGDLTVNGAGLTSLTINSTGAANVIGALATNGGVVTTTINAATALTMTSYAVGTSASDQSIVVSGAAADVAATTTAAAHSSVVLGTLGGDIKTVNASGLTAGGVSLTMDAGTDTTVTGGAGNDAITTGAVLATGSVNAGDGTDTLTIAVNAHLTATTGAKYTNFETLGVADGVTVDLDHVSGITAVVINDASNAATIANDLSATQAAAITMTDIEQAFTIGVKNAGDVGQLDTVHITVSDGDTTTSEDITTTAGTPTLTGVETLKITAVDDAEITLSAATTGSLTSIQLLGAGNHTLTTGDLASANASIDASVSTGANTINAATFATNGVNIKGGSAADTITGSVQADIIAGNAGADIIFNTVSGANASARDTITGGAGFDTFTLIGSSASAANYNGSSNITDFVVGTSATDTDFIRLSSVDADYSGALGAQGAADGAAGAVVLQTVAQSAGAAAFAAGAEFLKLTTGVAFTTDLQGTFNAAIGTSTITGAIAGEDYAGSYYDATNSKMVIFEVDPGGADTAIGTGDVVRLIGTIDMSAADYANIDADNFANFFA